MSGVPLKVAMWSGPRNISTAMMRAFENRLDTVVWDEPLYGYYLQATGLDHPGAQEIIDDLGGDWQSVVERIQGPIPEQAAVWYQKHMVHHLLPEVDRHWLANVVHCFLIREPRAVLASYYRKRENVTASDIGFASQAELFDRVCDDLGRVPPVLDAKDVLIDPRRMLGLLCDAVGIAFSDRMLSWPAGSRDSDGIWAKHWYAQVESSTGFMPYRPDTSNDRALSPELERIADSCQGYYDKLHEHRLG